MSIAPRALRTRPWVAVLAVVSAVALASCTSDAGTAGDTSTTSPGQSSTAVPSSGVPPTTGPPQSSQPQSSPAAPSSRPPSQPSTSSRPTGAEAPTGLAGSSGNLGMGCPTASTTPFAQARYVADVGRAAGTFHRDIYRPWRAHAFDRGATGRSAAITKAVATAAADAKLLATATETAKASPALCNAVRGPLSVASSGLLNLKANLDIGNLIPIAGIESQIQAALAASKAGGVPVTETTG